MGSACTTCVSNELDQKEIIQDLQDRTPQHVTPKVSPKAGNLDPDRQKFFAQTLKSEPDLPEEADLDTILKMARIKALMRGWIQRWRNRKHNLMSKSTNKYFGKAEANETLGGMYEANAPLE